MNYFKFNINPKFGAFAVSKAMIILLVTSILISFSFKKIPAKTPPNIIIILIDDAGYADFGFMGSKDLLTPNIDALTAQSVCFTDAHVTATVCSPSRAGLLTGKYQQRFGYECNEGDGYTGLDTAQILLPSLLKAKGYTTAAFGKWHLGFEANQHPLQKGFQHYYGFLAGGRSYFYKPLVDDKVGSKNALYENHKQVKFDGYLTDVLGDKAVDFIEQNSKQPFFIYWAPNAVHTPMEATQEDMEMFAKHPRQKLAAMTYALDRSIGKIINGLKKQGIYENTLIFFLSDNGGAHNNQSSNLPLKGFKGNEFEAGHRIPFLACWPKSLAANLAYKGITSSLDIFPTALAVAGINNNYLLDGVNLLPFITGKNKKNPHPELFWRKDKIAAVRYNEYKLIHVDGFGDRLYNLNNDLAESNDLCTTEPAIYKKLKEQLYNWEKDKLSPLWTEGPVWDSITYMIHEDLMNNKKVRVRNPAELEKFQSQKNK